MQEKEQEKSLIKQNILRYLSKKGVSAYVFYKESGVTRGVLQQNNGISEDNLARFLVYASDVNLEWLLTGEGAMLKGEVVSHDTREDLPIAHQTSTPGKGIPLIPFEAMAGAFTGEMSVMDYECEHYVVPAFQGADFLIPVKGDSMVPRYLSGDLVACQRVPLSDIFFQWGKTYILDTNQGPLIKRIKPGSDRYHILIVSENTDYPPFELPIDAINGVALVIGLIRLE